MRFAIVVSALVAILHPMPSVSVGTLFVLLIILPALLLFVAKPVPGGTRFREAKNWYGHFGEGSDRQTPSTEPTTD